MSTEATPASRPTRRFATLWLYALGGAAAVALGTMLYWLPPTETTWWYPRCFLYWLTGLHCPGCGATRSVSALVHGDLAQAAAYNLLFVALLPIVALWLMLWQVGIWTGWRWLCLRWPNWLLWTVLWVAVAFVIARNIPVEPYSLLAPHVLP